METKKQLREKILLKRKQLSKLEWLENSKVIENYLFQQPIFREAKNLLLYMDYNREVDTKNIFLQGIKDGKTMFYPKIRNDEMNFFKVEHLEELHLGYKGILEPIGNTQKFLCNSSKIELDKSLVIVPGVSFDLNRYRIGYGKGFYDRFLANDRQLLTIGICHQLQVIDEIPTDYYDIPVDILITERGVM